jgi:ketosteroid isomerase-like protein
MAQQIAAVAQIACTAFALALLGSSFSGSPGSGNTEALLAVHAVPDTIPCTGQLWPRHDDTTKAAHLARIAAQMQGLADSAGAVNASEEGGPEHEFFTSAAWVAYFAAAYGPDHLPTLLIASDVAEREARMEEGVIDSVFAKHAECYAERAVRVAQRQGDQAALSQARKLLAVIQEELSEGRRNAELERESRSIEAPATPLRDAAMAWAASFRSRDAEVITSFFSNDAVAWFPRGARPTVGNAEIRAAWTNYFKNNSAHPVSVDSVVSSATDGFGLVYGKYLYKEVSDSTADGGRYVAVWRALAGRWRLVLLSAHKHDDVTAATFRTR